jgi:sigma-B regulation protein RsbU (phosphoserine phosphatase)
MDGLRRDLILGVIVSIALLLSIVVIVLRTPHYLRGKYLESELQLAKRVQKNLQPRPHSIPPEIEFAASAVAADHVGGDFYDIFEAGSGKIAIVLGDVSGKGVPAALLVSMLQGAIRSSTASDHESACEKINRMLCERTACERFATLFWGIFDPANGTLRYVNAGHAAPILVRHRENRMDRLDEGGPVLGVLPMARYAAGAVQINPSDTLILYSDGVNEALNEREEEFGEDRILETMHCAADQPPGELCEQIMHQVTAFSNSGPSPDDRTLMVVRFLECGSAQEQRGSALRVLEEVA